MSQRLVTIIDTDVTLATHLQGELARYGLSAEVLADANELMGRKDGLPELVVLCIDPKRTGWAVCNRLRKSPQLKSIPLIITSAEATEKDFDDHKKLKTRAEEYLHKPFSVDALIEKIGTLITMPDAGGVEMESQEIDIEADLGDIDVEPEEIGDAVEYADEMTMGGNARTNHRGFEQAGEDERTRIGFTSEIDGEVDLETNAAFAAIGLDDPAEQTMQRPMPTAFDDDPFGLPEPPVTPARAAAPPVHAPPIPPVADAPPVTSASSPLFTHAPADQDSGPVPKLDTAELELADIARDAEQLVAETPPPIAHSVAYDNSALEAAQREIERLHRELDDARAKAAAAPAAAAASSSFTRDREFLTLRETINKKEKEVLDLKDALDAKDRQILDGKDKLREAERKTREGDERSLATERELVAAREKMEALAADKDRGVEREKQSKERLEDTQKALARAEGEIETWRGKHATDTAALDEKLNQTVSKYREEMGQLRQQQAESLAELKTEHTKALASTRSEHETRVQTQVAEHASRIESLVAEHETALSVQADEHRGTLDTELKAAERRQGEALVNLETKHEAALEEATGRHKEALRALTEESKRTLEQAIADHVAERGRLEADHTRALETLDTNKTEELAQLALQHADALAKAEEAATSAQVEALSAKEAEHEAALVAAREAHGRKLQALEESHDDLKAGMQARHATQIKDLRAQYDAAVVEWNAAITERDGIIGQHRDRGEELETALAAEQAQSHMHARRIQELEDEAEAAASSLAERAQTVQTRDARISELEQESARFQDQILRAYQRIKADESTVQRAKKALAIALTLLEESEPEKDEAVS
ncbi:MAG: response regulator [Polyangia bacterium]